MLPPAEIANPAMVAVAREARAWTQSDLAYQANVTQGYVSKVEAGLIELSGSKLLDVARALNVPVGLLTNTDPQQGLEVSCMFHRRRTSKVTVMAGRRVEAIGHLTRITVAGLEDGTSVVPSGLQRLDIDTFDTPEDVARTFRAQWRLPSGSIPNLMAVMDAVGVIVVIRPVGTAGQDAFSTWPAGGTPLMVVNTGLSIDRLRFTVAHELGHILMHVLPNENQELQANRFAAELLMPEAEIADDLAGLTTREFTRLMELKVKWRVSVGALVQRALSLSLISERQFKEFRIRMSQMGWNTSEPVQLSPESPALLTSIIQARRQTGLDDDALAAAAFMTAPAFAYHYLHAAVESHTAAEGTA